MLSLDDERWAALESAYRIPVDLRPLLRRLESAGDPKPVWRDLWDELHHRGAVGEGSFAALPHLVGIHRRRGAVDWNTYALAATIELARGVGRNPDVPGWARDSYDAALRELAGLGIEELPRARDRRSVRAILGLLAIVHGARIHGRLLIELSEDEVVQLEQAALAASRARVA
jgi:hypothetical protein